MNTQENKWTLFKQGATSPETLSVAKICAYGGMATGAGVAAIQLLYNHTWGFGIFAFFLAILQGISIISEVKTLKTIKQSLKDMNASAEEIQKIMKQMEAK